MTHPSWRELPFLNIGAGDSNDVCALRAVRWLLRRGVGLRPDEGGYKAFDLETGLGIYHPDLDWCIYRACVALHAASEAARKTAPEASGPAQR